MDKFKKGGNKFNSNITATNRLFAKNPLLKKRRKKAPGIYDPNAKYRFPDGGIVQLDRAPGSRFKKDKSGTWVYESGAPITDPFILQELNYGKGKPIGSPVVQGAPKVELKPYVTSGERIQKINDLQNSVKIADQQEANRLSQVQHHIDLYNPEVFEAERIKPKGLSDLQNWEWNVNEALNFPMERAHTAAAAATEDPGEEVDNLRHPLASKNTAESIINATGNIPYLSPAMGFIGSNLLGAGHEAMTLLNPDKNDDRSFLTRLQESGEDLYNNYVGAKVGASDMTPEEKTNYLLYLSGTNRLPDGIVMEGKPKKGFSKNVYFKHSPTDPGKYKSSYAAGGALLTKKVKCKKCGWQWNAADGGDDVTTCHKCNGQGLVQATEGGEYFEMDLTTKEIDEYRKGGFIVEDISVPSLNQMEEGGRPCPPGQYRVDGRCVQMNDLVNRKLKPYITNDPNDPRIKAFGDSLHLYNQTLANNKSLQGRGMTSQFTNVPTSEFQEKLYKKAKIKPVGFMKGSRTSRTPAGIKASEFPVYPMPRQEVIYKPKQKIKKPVPKKTQQVKPFVTSDPKEYALRKAAYDDSLRYYNAYQMQDKLMGPGSKIEKNSKYTWTTEDLKEGRKKRIVKGLERYGPIAQDYQNEAHQFKKGYNDWTATKADRELIKYYKSLGFTDKEIMYHSSPDVVSDKIKAVGSYYDGNASSPVYRKPMQEVIFQKNIQEDSQIQPIIPIEQPQPPIQDNYPPPPVGGFPPGPPPPPPFNGVEPDIQGDPIPEYATPDRDAQWVAQKERYIDWNGNNISYKLPRFRKPGHSGPLVKGSRTHYLRYPSIETRNSADIIPEEEEFAMGGQYIEAELTDKEIDDYRKGGFIVEDISEPTLNQYPNGGQIYTYSGNPNASYEKVGDQWYISNKGTGNKFVPIQDPEGKRTAELNKNAVLLPGQPAPVEAPRPVQGAPRPVISRHVWEDATGTIQQNAIAEEKYLQGLKTSPKLADQELAKQIELQKANAEKARKARDEYKMLHEQPLDMMDWAWGAAAALPVALPAIGEVAATNILGTPLTYGNVGSLGFATHSALNADNVVQDWKDVYAGKKDWRDAALNTGITGLGFIGAGSGVKNLASTLSGERVVASAMPGFNTARTLELNKFITNENKLLPQGFGNGSTPLALPSVPVTNMIEAAQSNLKIPEIIPVANITSPIETVKSIWQPQELSGLHLKSTMTDGPISKIVESKTGLINTEQALGIIAKESGGPEKVAMIKQALGKTVPKKMDYNDFRKLVQDQLIPLEKQLVNHSSTFGLQRIGHSPMGSQVKTYGLGDSDDAKIIENQTILFSNKNKFGIGSDAHSNPEETLGHAHFFRDSETPDALTITQLQSDAFQGPYRVMPKKGLDSEELDKELFKSRRMEEIQNRNKFILDKMKNERVDFNGNPVEDYQIKQFEEIVNSQEESNLLRKAHIEGFNQKSLLDKNHQERYIQEIVNYAAERGDINRLRLPTSETAAKIQGYIKTDQLNEGIDRDRIDMELENIFNTYGPDSEEMRNFYAYEEARRQEFIRQNQNVKVESDYSSEHKTILKKYAEQPKIIKKLYGIEPKIVTDGKGNTWYEFNIPYEFREGPAEIKAFKHGGSTSKLSKFIG